MERIEFKLTMPSNNAWNGKWTGDGKDYLKFKNITDKRSKELGIERGKSQQFCYSFGDGWTACVTARVMEKGEKRKQSAGFCGYDWMIMSILCYGEIKRP